MRSSRKSPILMLTAACGGLFIMAGTALAGGSIKGAIKLEGKAPKREPVNMKADPFCAKQQSGLDEEVVVASGGGLKNVVVRIAKGVSKPPAAPTEPAVIDQNGCMYRPRVVVAQAGQPVEIRNSDQTLHNVHTYKGSATLFNKAHIQGTGPLKQKFPTVGDVVKFKCDVHPWMTGWLLVSDNPHHAVTGDDGTFEIKDVPAGKYTVEIWHEKLGTQTKEVTVTDGAAADLKLSLKAK